ncbi:MAG: NUDIX hydrolase [Deltaproteobacteria bacterium]|nr:NUDIX hydrolase [Deltaproteobacteria bacterium]
MGSEGGAQTSGPRNPFPTVDVVVERGNGCVLLVRRTNPPLGWALPGGFIDYGEAAEAAARREVEEEAGVTVLLTDLLGVYSDPDRDPRHHTLTVVYIGRSRDPVTAGDDAAEVREFPLDSLPELAFDHARILRDYQHFKATGVLPRPTP